MPKISLSSVRTLCYFLPQSVTRILLRPHYQMAIYTLVAKLKKYSFVESIIQVGSGAKGKVRYGVSDLDFIVVISDSCDYLTHSKQIRKTVARVRQFFPEIQPEYETAIHSLEEMRVVISVQRPYLFSIPGMMKLLWSRREKFEEVEYSPCHELPIISRLWRKILLAKRQKSLDPNYLKHILRRIHSELDEMSIRLGIEYTSPDALTVEVAAHRMASLLERFEKKEQSLTRDVTHGEEVVIPNLLFFETSLLFDRLEQFDHPKDYLIVRRAGRSNITISELLNSKRLELDFLEFNNVFFPLKYDADARILAYCSHPLTLKYLNVGYRPGDLEQFRSIVVQSTDRVQQKFIECQRYLFTRVSRMDSFTGESSMTANTLKFQRVLCDLWREKFELPLLRP